jgi:YD repeat-containing protein
MQINHGGFYVGAPPDKVSTTDYDGLGRALHTVDAMGYDHYMSYDQRGELVKQWQAVAGNDGVTHTLYTAFSYDNLGRQTDVVTPGTNSVVSSGGIATLDQASAGVVHTRSMYNAYGEVVARGTYSNDEVAFDEQFEFDDAGHLIRTNSGDGTWKFMLYDVRGHETAQITGAGGTGGADLSLVTESAAAAALTVGVRRTDMEVDALGRVLLQELPEREEGDSGYSERPTVTQTFDRWGNVLTQTDARGATTTFRYNANNQVVEEVRPGVYYESYDYSGFDEARTLIRYDALGRQVAVIDADGNVNGQVWDAAGNLTEELRADGGQVGYSYDGFNRRVAMNDAMGDLTQYAYNALDRLTDVTSGVVDVANADSSYNVDVQQLALTTHYTYDAAGRKLTETNGAGEVTSYTNDLRGNVTGTQQPMGQVSRAAFDAVGHQVGSQDANGALSTWAYHDNFDQLDSYTDIGSATHWLEYDNARQLVRNYSTRGQDTRYAYDAAGQLVGINDLTIGESTTYAYDLAGNRTRETTTKNGVVYQDNHLEYDLLDRLAVVQALDGISMGFQYDAVGNRLHQTTFGSGLAHSVATTTQVLVGYDESNAPMYADQTTYQTVFDGTQQDFWYEYDAMNRQVLVDGLHAWDLSTDNVDSSQGHILTYDYNGNRTSDTHWGQQVTKQHIVSYDESSNPFYVGTPSLPAGSTVYSYDANSAVIEQYANREGAITEYYGYDAANRLSTVATGGFDENLQPLDPSLAITLDRRYYDGAGRLVRMGPAGTLDQAYLDQLNAGGTPDANGAITRTNRYDADGRMTDQMVQNPDGTTQYTVSYTGYDAAGNVTSYSVNDTHVTSTYNITQAKFEGYKEGSVSGYRSDNTSQVRTTFDHYDANGNLVAIDDDTGSTDAFRVFVNDTNGVALQKTQDGHVFNQLVVNGQVYATYGEVEDPQHPGQYTTQTTFNASYEPITNVYPSAATGTYSVKAGDTLESIAQASYGDSQLWYLIADANGLQSNNDLRIGQTLNIPLKVGGVHNNESTFKPYDPSQIIGSTTPTLPVPQKKGGGCGGLGQIIMIVVAVAVTIMTEGATSEFLVAALGETAGSIAAAAVGAAVGSIASQAVGNVIGAVDGFSWKQVALAAISAGVTEGVVPNMGLPDLGSSIANQALSHAVGSALTQGIAVATGLQKSFSWTAVAASAAGASVGQAVGGALGRAFGDFGGRVATSLVAGTATALARGGRVSVQQIAIDAFGNALGSDLAARGTSGNLPGPITEQDRASDLALFDGSGLNGTSAPQNDDLGDFIGQQVAQQNQRDMGNAQNAFRQSEIAAESDRDRSMGSGGGLRIGGNGVGIGSSSIAASAWGNRVDNGIYQAETYERNLDVAAGPPQPGMVYTDAGYQSVDGGTSGSADRLYAQVMTAVRGLSGAGSLGFGAGSRPGQMNPGGYDPVTEQYDNSTGTPGLRLPDLYVPPSIVQGINSAINIGFPIANALANLVFSSQLPQDANVNPSAPSALPLSRPIGTSDAQNQRLQNDIFDALSSGATDLRVNQQQVDARGNRVGINRPDLQYTDANGNRVYVEYDRASSDRGPKHETRITTNDPSGRVVLIRQD